MACSLSGVLSERECYHGSPERIERVGCWPAKKSVGRLCEEGSESVYWYEASRQ
jgi:hypothetical protein